MSSQPKLQTNKLSSQEGGRSQESDDIVEATMGCFTSWLLVCDRIQFVLTAGAILSYGWCHLLPKPAVGSWAAVTEHRRRAA